MIFVPCLDKLGFHFNFGDGKLILMFDFQGVGYGYLVDDLYKLSLVSDSLSSSLNVENAISKRPKTEEKSSLLLHKRLGHIFRKRIVS